MSQRTQRLADQIQREIAGLIRTEIKDPRLGMITVSSVKVSPDMGYADIYVTVMGASIGEGQDEKPEASIAVLNAAAGFFVAKLAAPSRLELRRACAFILIKVVARGNRMAELINRAVKEDEGRAAERGEDAAAANDD